MARTLEQIKGDIAETIRLQKQILDKAEKEKRNLTAEEERRYQEIEEDFKNLTAEKRYLENNPTVNEHLSRSSREPIRPLPTENIHHSTPEEIRAASRAAYGEGEIRMHGRNNHIEFREEQYEKAGRALLGLETRTLQKDLDTAGGFTVKTEELANMILHALDNNVFIRKFATIFTADTADRFGIPFMDNDMSDLSWTGEVTPASLDTTMSFEKRSMMPKRLAKAIKVGNELKDISKPDFARFVIGRGTYKTAVVEENAFLNGSGFGQPLGIFTVDANGCDTDRNVSTDNTSTTLKAGNLIEVYHSLTAPHLQSPSLRWIFSRYTLKLIRKLQDGEGNYLWSPGIGADNPPTVLGVPYIISEYAPGASAYVSGARVACLADLQYYGIAQRKADISVKVLDQLYALENATAYLFQTWVDGMPLLSSAFSFCTLG